MYERPHIQNVLDLLGYAENLPLQILNVSALYEIPANELSDDRLPPHESEKQLSKLRYSLRREFKKIDEDSSLAEFSSNRYLYNPSIPPTDRFEKLPNLLQALASPQKTSAIHKIESLENQVWCNLSSNPLHIDSLFRLSYEWRWYILVWTFLNRKIFKEPGIDHAYDMLGWKLYWEPLELSGNEYTLVVGPIYETTKRRDIATFHKTRALKILEAFCLFYHKYGRWGITRRFSLEELERVVHARTPISETTVKHRIGTPLSVLKCLGSAIRGGLLDTIDGLLKRKPYLLSQIAKGLVMSQRLTSSQSFIALASESRTNNSQSLSYLRFSFPLYDESGDYYEFSVGTNRKENEWQHSAEIVVAPKETPSETGLVRSVKINGEPPIEGRTTRIIQDIEHKIERWGERINARRRNLQTLRARMLGDWLNHQHLLTPSPRNYSDVGTGIRDDLTEYFNFICGVINEGLRTDLCTIYKYDSHLDEGGLRILGHATRPNTWQPNEIEQVFSHMEELANTYTNQPKELKTRSVVFASIARCVTQYILGCTSSAAEQVKSRDDLTLSWPDQVAFPGDIMATPILIQGRVWGVIEVLTKHVHSIESYLRFSLNHFATLLGAYFYNITLMRCLKDMRSISKRSPHDESFTRTIDDLCDSICQIYLARSVVVFVKSNTHPYKYDLAGMAGYRYFTEPDSFSLDMSDSHDRKLLAGLLYTAYQKTGTRALIARIDPTDVDRQVNDHTPYVVLGMKYVANSNTHSIINALVDDNIRQALVFAFDFQDQNLDERADPRISGQEHKLLRHLSDALKSKQKQPLGIVLVCHRRFTNLPHWNGITDLLSEYLTQCVDDVLIGRTREEARGRMVRHEVKKGVRALQGSYKVLGSTLKALQHTLNRIPLSLVVNDSNSCLSETDWYKLSNLEKTRVLEWLAELPRIMQDYRWNADDAIKRIENLSGQFDDLQVQVESIDRPVLFNLERFLGLEPAFDEIRVDSTVIMRTILNARTEYQRELTKNKGMYLDVEGINRGTEIRLTPKTMAYLFRNIFDNWNKYSKDHTALEISLERKRTHEFDGYHLQFKNFGDTPSSLEDVNRWFEFGVRGTDVPTSSTGDGIGLYWIDMILSAMYRIPVFFKVLPTPVDGVSQFVLTWVLEKHWIKEY